MWYHKLVTLCHRLHIWKLVPLRYKPIRDKWVNTIMWSHSRSKLLNGENIRNVEFFFSFEKGYIPKEITLLCYYLPLLVNRNSAGRGGTWESK